MSRSVREVALSDLSEALGKVQNPHEIWLVRGSHLDTKETRELNRVLDLHKVNKQK